MEPEELKKELNSLKETITLLEKSVSSLSENLKEEKKPKKDFWDKLGSITTFMSSIVVALLGIYITEAYKDKQNQQDNLIRREQNRISKAELVHKFIPYFSQTDVRVQRSAILAIYSLGYDSLSIELAKLYGEQGGKDALSNLVSYPDKNTQQLAENAILQLNKSPELGPSAGVGSSAIGLTALQSALKELDAGAREIGGENKGEFVRKYMRGNEGSQWPWAGGFISWCFEQGGKDKMPFPYAYSFDILFETFRSRKWLHILPTNETPVPGDVYLIGRKIGDGKFDAMHAGIVEKYENGLIIGIEGNTNDGGERLGYKVAKRVRKIDAILAFAHIPTPP